MSSRTPDAGAAPPRSSAAGTLLSVNVGLPRDVPWQGKTVFTGVFKEPVTGPRRVRGLNIDGDGQGDLAGAAPASGVLELMLAMSREAVLGEYVDE